MRRRAEPLIAKAPTISECDRLEQTLPESQNARLEDDAARDAKLSAGDPQLDDHGNEARPDTGKEGGLARPGAVGAGRAEAAPKGNRVLPEPTERDSLSRTALLASTPFS
jgi:hypothetical protein